MNRHDPDEVAAEIREHEADADMTTREWCPECYSGKHSNCTGIALDANDDWTVCTCC